MACMDSVKVPTTKARLLPRLSSLLPFRVGRAWRLLILVCAISGLSLAASAADDSTAANLYTFTNQDGRTLKGTIVSVTGDTVSLKRENGDAVTLKTATLIKADQSYIQQWLVKQYTAHNRTLFEATATSSRGPDTVDNSQPGHVMTTWQEGYKVTLKNQTTLSFTKLRADYIVFSKELDIGATKNPEGPLQPQTGTAKFDALGSSGSTTFETAKMDMQQMVLRSGFKWSTGGSGIHADYLQGMWLRIYDENNNLLQEWVSSPALKNVTSWDANWGHSISAPRKPAQAATTTTGK